MSRVHSPRSNRTLPQVDLPAIRDTLLYISSDIERVDGLETVAARVREALEELEKLEGAKRRAASPIAVTFVPARIE